MLHLMWQIHHSKAENTKQANQNSKYANQNGKYTNQNSKYAKQNSKYAQYQFTLFIAMQFLLQIYALFWRTIYRPKKVVAYKKNKYEVCCWAKMTNNKFSTLYSSKKKWFTLQQMKAYSTRSRAEY